jgi:AraC family transcriptional regulator
MDWVEHMNDVVEYIETHLDSEINYDVFGKMLCCSTYEFSRIFSFIAGMSISEYIRRRRLSQAALDIQSGYEKIIDIALKYGYESQAAFTRAFKEMHGQKPLSARKSGVSLKTYPKISFALIIKGVNEMNFRIEKMNSFRLTGKKNTGGYEYWCEFDKKYLPDFKKNGLIKAPFWYVGAYFLNRAENEACIIGAELKDSNVPEGMDVEIIPGTTWAVFPFVFRPGEDAAGETYAKVVTEWLPTSNYVRNENAPYLEVYGHGANQFEVWVPII